jgi:large subunit ribosomal protein L19
MIHPLIKAAEQSSTKQELPQFRVGDTVEVHYRIVEGKKERIQRFSGDVIAVSGRGPTKAFTVRRILAGEGVERIFPYHSPNVEKVDVKRSGKARRAKLFFLRKRVGKATRLVEKRMTEESAAAGDDIAASTAKAPTKKSRQLQAADA